MTADEGAIQDILKQIEAAWNSYDSVSLAALFAEDANFIQIFGGQLDGRTSFLSPRPGPALAIAPHPYRSASPGAFIGSY